MHRNVSSDKVSFTRNLKKASFENGAPPCEQGSHFHWPASFETKKCAASCEMRLRNSVFFSCGRTALSAIVKHGLDNCLWKRLWLPTYFCEEVINAVRETCIVLRFYACLPFEEPSPPEDIKAGDVLLIVNYFGFGLPEDFADFYKLGIPIIEDHTHDPFSAWAKQSNVTYSFASLRKYLPIPDGAAVWSNAGAQLPAEPESNGVGSTAALIKLEAMLLKSLYLSFGDPGVKDTYLYLFNKGEKSFGFHSTRSISPLSRVLLSRFSWSIWRSQRLANFQFLTGRLQASKHMDVLKPSSGDICPFAVIITFRYASARDRVFKSLNDRNIYPAVLWPLDASDRSWSDKRSFDWSQRMLSIHCDGRYSINDMERVSDILSNVLDV